MTSFTDLPLEVRIKTVLLLEETELLKLYKATEESRVQWVVLYCWCGVRSYTVRAPSSQQIRLLKHLHAYNCKHRSGLSPRGMTIVITISYARRYHKVYNVVKDIRQYHQDNGMRELDLWVAHCNSIRVISAKSFKESWDPLRIIVESNWNSIDVIEDFNSYSPAWHRVEISSESKWAWLAFKVDFPLENVDELHIKSPKIDISVPVTVRNVDLISNDVRGAKLIKSTSLSLHYTALQARDLQYLEAEGKIQHVSMDQCLLYDYWPTGFEMADCMQGNYNPHIPISSETSFHGTEVTNPYLSTVRALHARYPFLNPAPQLEQLDIDIAASERRRMHLYRCLMENEAQLLEKR